MKTKKAKMIIFFDMFEKVKKRGFKPKFVMFDTWYASVKNLKDIRGKQWNFVTIQPW